MKAMEANFEKELLFLAAKFNRNIIFTFHLHIHLHISSCNIYNRHIRKLLQHQHRLIAALKRPTPITSL